MEASGAGKNGDAEVLPEEDDRTERTALLNLGQAATGRLPMVCAGCAFFGVLVAAIGIYVRHLGFGRCRLSARTSALVCMLATTLMAAASWWFAFREAEMPASHDPLAQYYRQIDLAPPSGKLPIEVGDEFSLWAAKGWLNGGPPSHCELAEQIVVIDTWNEL